MPSSDGTDGDAHDDHNEWCDDDHGSGCGNSNTSNGGEASDSCGGDADDDNTGDDDSHSDIDDDESSSDDPSNLFHFHFFLYHLPLCTEFVLSDVSPRKKKGRLEKQNTFSSSLFSLDARQAINSSSPKAPL